jgi:hypothetical protein
MVINPWGPSRVLFQGATSFRLPAYVGSGGEEGSPVGEHMQADHHEIFILAS